MIEMLIQLESGELQPGVYRCDGLEDLAGVEDHFAEKGWRAFQVDGRLIVDKRSFLETMAAAMAFPGYVAGNWDAFEEAIRDLEWVPATGYLIIYDYPQVFAAYQPGAWQTALSILRSAIADWRAYDVPLLVLLCRTDEGLAGIPRLQSRDTPEVGS